ncbi:MAG: ABC transporter ATP-binding protein [Hydrogenophaga sp.]|nr:ABC transporter ATP-binding protein [Hydrogenophaga sp.]
MEVRFSTDHGTVAAVRGLTYDVYAGEILAIVGESGSGKSVTSLAVTRLLPGNATVTADAIRFGGIDLQSLTDAEMRALRGPGIGMIFQDPMTALNPVMTVGDQLLEPLRQHMGLNARQARERALELLMLVGIPDAKTRIDHYPHQFSGGMRQRVMIAIGLSCNPKLLIADEPTTALDVTIQAQILDLMQELCQRLNIALVIITHNLGVVARYADRVLVMYGGQMLEQGTAHTVFTTPRHLYTEGLLASVPTLERALSERLEGIEGTPPNPSHMPPGCAFAPRCRHALAACETPGPLVLTDVGSLSACVRAADIAAGRVHWAQPSVVSVARADRVGEPVPGAKAEPLVCVQGLEKTYTLKKGVLGARQQVHALRDVSLSIGRRETVGVVGESGCGKSTLGKLLLRLEEPTGGRVLFRGEDITHLGDRALRGFRRHTQVIFQDPYSSLNPRKRIGHILMEPMLVHGIVANRDEAREDAQRLLREVGLRSEHAERFAHQLSGGQRQRVAIARALAMRPEFIVCDEAVSALDVSVQAQVVNLLTDLQERLNLSYLFIGHDLAVVRQIATRVVVMYLGRVVEIADRDDFYRQPMHPYSQALMAAVPSVEALGLKTQKKFEIRGEPPSPMAPPSGCAFRTRCALAGADCADTVPELRTVAGGRQVACLRVA